VADLTTLYLAERLRRANYRIHPSQSSSLPVALSAVARIRVGLTACRTTRSRNIRQSFAAADSLVPEPMVLRPLAAIHSSHNSLEDWSLA
jgi:hypothetical protein